jgi:hypothetical protein
MKAWQNNWKYSGSGSANSSIDAAIVAQSSKTKSSKSRFLPSGNAAG